MQVQALLAVLLVQVCIQMAPAKDNHNSRDVLVNIAKNTAAFRNQIEKLEKKFTGLYTKYMTLHERINHNITEQQFEKDLAAVNRRSTELLSRTRRSGACAEICTHRCLPSCNFACCIARPAGMNRKIINKLEVTASKKSILERKKSILKHRPNKEEAVIKNLLERGQICVPSCLVHCEPSCKFKCCIKHPK